MATQSLSPESKARHNAAIRRHKQRNPEKVKARNLIVSALRNGSLIRGNCEVCGKPHAEAHHDDYSKPLDVRWLCKRHHVDAHKASLTRVPKTHCPRGHEYSPDNTYIHRTTGVKSCRICSMNSAKRSYQKRKQCSAR